MSETPPPPNAASLAAAAAAASPGLNWADDVDDELKPSRTSAKNAAASGGAGGDDDDAPPGFEHVSPGVGTAADPAEALVAKIGGVAVSSVERRREGKEIFPRRFFDRKGGGEGGSLPFIFVFFFLNLDLDLFSNPKQN